MKNRFKVRAPSFDADAINATIQRALTCAGLNTTNGPMHEVTRTIRHALAAGRLAEAEPTLDNDDDIEGSAPIVPVLRQDPGAVYDQEARDREAAQGRGRFSTHAFSNQAGSRNCKVYVPARPSSVPRPMVVMLHGCTQSADDFAAGTQMNRLADQYGFLVLYPEQALGANASRCWNWFKPEDQARGAGEPSLIAGMVSDLAPRIGADPRRIYVAGLSAGAAMAVVLGETYPDMFAGVGAHSGLPYGSAHDIPSALAAMKGGRSGSRGLKGTPVAARPAHRKAMRAVPVIVFHGDRDHTVQSTNSASIVQQAQDAHEALPDATPLQLSTQSGVTATGRRFSRTVHTNALGQIRIESWTLHGAGHAWSGGHSSGSYTDHTGPDASAEMVRFFMAIPGAGSA